MSKKQCLKRDLVNDAVIDAFDSIEDLEEVGFTCKKTGKITIIKKKDIEKIKKERLIKK